MNSVLPTLVICGDSFAVPDPEYGQCWVDLLEDKLYGQVKLINLSCIAASNLQIATQIDRAIKQQADFIIALCTSCTREDIKYQEGTHKDLYERFEHEEIKSYSIPTIDILPTNLTKDQIKLIKQYQSMFFDLDLAIYKNQCIIENSLQKLVDSKIDFVFDQGGFEHPKFGNTTQRYFSKFDQYRSQINLWDYTDARTLRPYHHISNLDMHKEISEYYYNKIIKHVLTN